ncbi:MAG: UDP-N-acetylglucosamine 1-carboxyvinyltransferase, partial [Thermoleophilia bacterium]|nr:UDP-N-acetylglucosamine 1-carboxyvinyltransferase [Thermoleophilia bacterium]
MSERFVIEGGHALSGTIVPAGNKNAALPVLAASLLTDEEVVLENVPDIVDVRVMLALLEHLGVSVRQEGANTVCLRAGEVKDVALDPELCSRLRASLLLAGPLLARCGAVDLPLPGGDFIGRRRVDTHLLGFRALGADIVVARNYRMTASKLTGRQIFLDEASVTGTENILMAAVLADGETIILNAAGEPHVQDLARVLVGMGASIQGIGTNRLVVQGVDALHGGRFAIGPDHIEVASFIGLGAITNSDLTIAGVRADDMRMINLTFARLGIEVEMDGDTLRVPPNQGLQIVSDEGEAIPKIDDGVWPAFPADLTSIAVAVATQAHGTIMIFEKMFENRLFFVDKLVAMGARIVLCDPHRAVVSGPARLNGERLESPDIRAGMALLIASLAAEGESVIGNIRQIDRGYERIDERLRAVGAHIE